MANFKLENYVPVHTRLAQFYQDHPQGRVNTSIVEHDREAGFVMIRSEVYRSSDDAMPSATGHAFEERGQGYVNKTSYVENAETSATGRALALLGYEISKGMASREEMQKVERMTQDLPVVRENGHYVVDNKFRVSKPNSKVVCDCGAPKCPHIDAVRLFTIESN